jgi:hypothetical protein
MSYLAQSGHESYSLLGGSAWALWRDGKLGDKAATLSIKSWMVLMGLLTLVVKNIY